MPRRRDHARGHAAAATREFARYFATGMVRVATCAAELPGAEAFRMATLTPAERTGIAGTTGSLEKGKRADIIVLNGRLDVKRTFVNGVEVSR